jgi:hypothetical protein
MDTTPTDAFNELFIEAVADLKNRELDAESTTTAINNFVNLSKAQPTPPEPVVDPNPVPETRWGRVKLGVRNAWDNETTRTVIKAGGSLLGVVVVANATIKKDHVLERQALDQAHQPPAR